MLKEEWILLSSHQIFAYMMILLIIQQPLSFLAGLLKINFQVKKYARAFLNNLGLNKETNNNKNIFSGMIKMQKFLIIIWLVREW